MLKGAQQTFAPIVLHLFIILYGLFGISALSQSLGDDFINIHKAAIGMLVIMIVGSALAIYSLIKKTRWSLSYATILGAFYFLIFIVPSLLFWLEA